MKQHRNLYIGLLLLLAARILAMFTIPLTDPTEGRYAEIARKMVETNNWITPLFDYGVPFWAKPPLSTWVSAVGIELFGATPFGARFGVLIVTLLVLAIIWWWVETLASRALALASIAVLLASGLFFVAVGFVQTDMVLTLGTVACMAGFHASLNIHRNWIWLFFTGLVIGLLAKGPIAVVLPGAPIFIWLLWHRKWAALKTIPWFSGTAFVVILALPWYIAAERATPGFLHYFIIGEHIQRFLQPGWTGDLYGAGREHPKGMIWIFWLIAALPWTPLLPFLFWRLRKAGPGGIPKRADRLYSYLLLFAVVPLVFFTPAANTIVTYVLPGMPAAAILATLLWARVMTDRGIWLTVGIVEIVVIGFCLSAAIYLGADRYLPGPGELPRQVSEATPMAILDNRSFSAEFYRNGKIQTLKNMDELAAWAKPGSAVLVPRRLNADVVSQFGDRAVLQGSNKNYSLYVIDGTGQ